MRRLLIPLADPAAYRRKDDETVAGGVIQLKASHGALEVKADEENPGQIKGYGSVFGKVDSYNETVEPGAFAKSIKRWKRSKNPLPMLWQHHSSEPIGIWPELDEDDKGLKLDGEIILEVPEGAKAWALAKRKAVTGLSIGYYEVKADPWNWESTEPRKLYELDLREVSVVTFPALKEAQIDAVKARMMRGERPTLREFEALLREQGQFSRSEAQEIAALGYKAWLQREVGTGDGDDLADLVADLRSTLPPLELPTF